MNPPLPLPKELVLSVSPAEYDAIQTALHMVTSLRERLAAQVQCQREALRDELRRDAWSERKAKEAAAAPEMGAALHE